MNYEEFKENLANDVKEQMESKYGSEVTVETRMEITDIMSFCTQKILKPERYRSISAHREIWESPVKLLLQLIRGQILPMPIRGRRLMVSCVFIQITQLPVNRPIRILSNTTHW